MPRLVRQRSLKKTREQSGALGAKLRIGGECAWVFGVFTPADLRRQICGIPLQRRPIDCGRRRYRHRRQLPRGYRSVLSSGRTGVRVVRPE